MEVLERGREVIFTHRLVPGAADRSYGIHVARLAGVPAAVTARAEAILAELEARGAPLAAPSVGTAARAALELVDRLRALDPLQLSPMQALSELQALCESLDEPTLAGG
jgi:DNA mismatch repair protein MutS